MYIFRGGEKVAPKGMYICLNSGTGPELFSNVTCDNVLKNLIASSCDYYWNNTRICVMRLFNTGLNNLHFRVLKTLMYPYTTCVYVVGAIWVVTQTEICGKGRGVRGGGGRAVAIGFLLQGGLIASLPHTQRR
jgi:hypothetical protein